MSKPMLLVLVVVVLIITSQFEWRQPLMSDIETNPRDSEKQPQISKREETVKEKIILTQEKNILRLNELVRSLRAQLHQCRNNNETSNSTVSSVTEDSTMSSVTEDAIDLEQQQMIED